MRKTRAPRRRQRKGRKGTKAAKARKNEDTFSLTCRSSATSTPFQGGLVSNYVYIAAQLISTSASQSVLNNAEYRLFSTIYDQVRINRVKMTIKPKANVNDLARNQNDAFSNAGDGMYHTVIDRDSLPASNVNVFQKYSSYKKQSILKPLTRTYSVKYPDGVWLDCRNELSDQTLLARLGLLGGIFLYAEDIQEDAGEVFNEPWAFVEWEYHVVFRGKCCPLIAESAGTLTLLAPELLPAAVPTPLFNVRGDIRAPGNMIIDQEVDKGGGDKGLETVANVDPATFAP